MPPSSCACRTAAPRATRALQVEKKDLKECMKARPYECEQFRYALFHCRKGQVDARTRIQGNKVRCQGAARAAMHGYTCVATHVWLRTCSCAHVAAHAWLRTHGCHVFGSQSSRCGACVQGY